MNQKENFEDSNLDNQISAAVKELVLKSGQSQRDVASSLGITEVSVSKMLSGVSPLPLERFFQIIALLNPNRNVANTIFALYQKKFSIPPEAIALLDGGWIMQKYKSLVAIPEADRSEMNRKEIEVIRYWFNIQSETGKSLENNRRERIYKLIDLIPDADCELVEMFLERLTK